MDVDYYSVDTRVDSDSVLSAVESSESTDGNPLYLLTVAHPSRFEATETFAYGESGVENVGYVVEKNADGTYRLQTPVKIGMMVDFKAIYMVGQGELTHDSNGFTLTGCDGKLNYTQGALANYGLYADYLWYEIGDVICIGNNDVLYYCFPENCGDVVAKTRMAAEELYKLKKRRPAGEKQCIN